MEAVARGSVLRRKELHENEIGVALLASMQANSQRDRKKSPKPYSFQDFCFYSEGSTEESASVRYGSAMLALNRAGQFPTWALFCYNGLGKNADPNFKPDILSFQCEDAILLAPVKVDLGWTGFLIARESASEGVRSLVNEHGEVIRVTMPFIETKVVAREDVTLS